MYEKNPLSETKEDDVKKLNVEFEVVLDATANKTLLEKEFIKTLKAGATDTNINVFFNYRVCVHGKQCITRRLKGPPTNQEGGGNESGNSRSPGTRR